MAAIVVVVMVSMRTPIRGEAFALAGDSQEVCVGGVGFRWRAGRAGPAGESCYHHA